MEFWYLTGWRLKFSIRRTFADIRPRFPIYGMRGCQGDGTVGGGTIFCHQAICCLGGTVRFCLLSASSSGDRLRATSFGMHGGRLHRTNVMVESGYADWEAASVSRGTEGRFQRRERLGRKGLAWGRISPRICVGEKRICGAGHRKSEKEKVRPLRPGGGPGLPGGL